MKSDIPVARSTFPRPSMVGGNVEIAEAYIGQGKSLQHLLRWHKWRLLLQMVEGR